MKKKMLNWLNAKAPPNAKVKSVEREAGLLPGQVMFSALYMLIHGFPPKHLRQKTLGL